jgi:YVTN family beta-propeller protein
MKWTVAAGLLVGVLMARTGNLAMGQDTKKEPQAKPELRATPSPVLVVLDKEESELAIVDAGTLQVVGRVKTGPVPHEVAVSGDGKIAVTTNYGAKQDGTTLSVIDLAAQREMQRVELGELRGPHGIAFFGGKFYFTAEGSNAIARYDAAKNQVDWTMATSQERTHMLVLTRDGEKIFTANVVSNTVTCLARDAKKNTWSTTQIAVGKGPEGIDLAPDGSEVWAANSGEGTVSVIDVGSKKVVGTVDVRTKHSNRLKFTPDGKLVLITDMGSGDLVVMDAVTRKEVKRMHLGSSVEGILMQPDGARAFVAVSGDDKVAVLDLKTLAVTGTFTTGKDPDGLAWGEWERVRR